MSSSYVGREGYRARQLRVVALALVAVLILGWAVLKVGALFDVFTPRYEVTTLVPTAAGLREGAPVTVAGQQAGQVTGIHFIPLEEVADTNHIRVVMELSRNVASQVRIDSRAQIRSAGLLGDKFVDITPGGPSQPIVEDGGRIASSSTVDLDLVLDRAVTMLDSTQTFINELGDVAGSLARGEGTLGALLVDDALYDRFASASGELAALLGTLARGDGTVGRLIHDPAIYERLVGTLGRLDTLSARIEAGEGTLGRLVASDSLYLGLLASAHAADTALASLSVVLGRIEAGEGTLGRMATDPVLYDELLKTITDLQSVIAAIREDPRRIRPEVTVDVF
jgi:phospholipid/cholesterol/gamma-HCH transport system substrate-binding protein